MRHLEGRKVFLRDFIESDIEDRIHWETVETEWQDWDAPWEKDIESFDAEAYRERMLKYLSERSGNEGSGNSFEICIKENGKHIGWINSYRIDDDYSFSREGHHFTIGIGIPPLDERRKGYATDAWVTYIGYLMNKGIEDVYTQTWSGNDRVIGLINKLGFRELSRYRDYREVGSKFYDGLTFKLDVEVFRDFIRTYQNTTPLDS